MYTCISYLTSEKSSRGNPQGILKGNMSHFHCLICRVSLMIKGGLTNNDEKRIIPIE